jgi:hypothetical protein
MKIFITKNGQRIGPFTPDEIRRKLQDGTLLLTDWAWYEGQPDWMALHQIPGFNFAAATQRPSAASLPAPELRRPVLVWVISLFLFVYVPFTVLYMLFTMARSYYMLVSSGNSTQTFISMFPFFTVALILLIKTIELAGAVCLFLLRRASLYLFAIALALSLVNLLYLIIFKNWPHHYEGNSFVFYKMMVEVVLSYLLYFAIISYTGYLYFNKTLR